MFVFFFVCLFVYLLFVPRLLDFRCLFVLCVLLLVCSSSSTKTSTMFFPAADGNPHHLPQKRPRAQGLFLLLSVPLVCFLLSVSSMFSWFVLLCLLHYYDHCCCCSYRCCCYCCCSCCCCRRRRLMLLLFGRLFAASCYVFDCLAVLCRLPVGWLCLFYLTVNKVE